MCIRGFYEWIELIIKGVHYGLTLLYSYLLPVINLDERAGGFIFSIEYGELKGLECRFNESTLETTCSISGSPSAPSLERILGLEKHWLFREVCSRLNIEKCIANQVTLVYEPLYKKIVAYSIYLSRNTDYYVNTLKWVREAVLKKYIDSQSYIPREFNAVRDQIDNVVTNGKTPLEEVLGLMKIPGFGVKSANAYLLHVYGLTEYAPIDRHYAKLLGKITLISKSACLRNGRLYCKQCSINCPYRHAQSRFGVLNGVIQSLIYVYGRLKNPRKTSIEEILVGSREYYIDEFEELITKVKNVYQV